MTLTHVSACFHFLTFDMLSSPQVTVNASRPSHCGRLEAILYVLPLPACSHRYFRFRSTFLASINTGSQWYRSQLTMCKLWKKLVNTYQVCFQVLQGWRAGVQRRCSDFLYGSEGWISPLSQPPGDGGSLGIK